MAFFSTKLRLVRDALQVDNSHYTEYWSASTIEFGVNQVIWCISHLDSIPHIPAGAQAQAIHCIPPGGFEAPGQSGGFETGISPIANHTFVYTDLQGQISDVIADKYINGFGTRDKIHRTYRWPVGEDLDEVRHLQSTMFISDRQTGDGQKEIQCVDIKRKLKNKILKPLEWNLVQAIGTSDNDPIIIHGPEPKYFEHSDHYKADPNKTIAYFRTSEGEIIGFEGHTPVAGQENQYTLQTPQRAALGSNAVAVKVDTSQKVFNRPTLKEWTRYEEYTANFIYGLATGRTLDGRVLPEHWHANVDEQWINRVALSLAAPDLNLMPWRAENYGEVGCKELLENEVLPYVPGFFLTNAFAALQIYRMTSVAEVGSDQFEFNKSNVDTRRVSKLRTKNSQIANAIRFEYNWDPLTEAYGTNYVITDADSLQTNPDAGTHVLQSKLITTDLHTNSQINYFAGVIGDIKFHEIVEIDFPALPSTKGVSVGDRVQVNFDFIRDDSTDVANHVKLNRSMVVTAKRPDDNGGYTYTAYGTRKRASTSLDSLLTQHLPDSAHTQNGVDLSTVATITQSGGLWTVQGNFQVSLNQKYYFDKGPLIIPDGVTVTANDFGPFWDLWVSDAFQMLGVIDFTGRGHHLGGGPNQLGDRGYVLPVHSGGGIHGKPRWHAASNDELQLGLTDRVHYTSTEPLKYQDYTSGDAPHEALALNNGVLTGLPTDLAGYGGPGSPPMKYERVPPAGKINDIQTVEIPGKNGGRSGAGVRIVCRGLSHGPNSKYITTGEAGEAGTLWGSPNYIAVSGGSGGGPGSVRAYMDGNYLVEDISQYVDAFCGASTTPGVPVLGNPSLEVLAVRSSYFRPTSSTTNFARAVTRVTQIPAPEEVQERQPTEDDLLFANQRDNKIKLYPQDTQPANANAGDVWITPDELKNGSRTTPTAYIFRENGEWTAAVWPNEYGGFLTLINNYRDNKGTQYFNQATRPAEGTYANGDIWRDPVARVRWILNTSGEDTLDARDGVDLGDERFGDPNFVNSKNGEHFWYFNSDPTALPTFPVAQAGTQSIFFTIDTLDTGVEFVNFTLNPPINVNAVVYSASQIELFWGFPSGAQDIDGYEVYRNGQTVATTIEGAHLFSGLSAGTQYRIGVRSINNEGEVSGTVEVIEFTDGSSGSTINPPTNAQINFTSNTSGIFTFTKPVLVSGITGYKIRRNGVEIITLGSSAAATHTFTDLAAGTSYNFSVVSVTASGESSAASVSGTTGGGSGGSFIAVNASGNTINGRTVSGTSSGIYHAGLPQVYIPHVDGAAQAPVNPDGTWSHTFPGTHGNSQTNPYVEDAAGNGYTSPNGPFQLVV